MASAAIATPAVEEAVDNKDATQTAQLEKGDSDKTANNVDSDDEDYADLGVKTVETAGPDPPSVAIVGGDAENDKEDVVSPDDEQRNLIINYLPPTWAENDVMSYFSPYGEIENCKVVIDLHTGKSKGYGFVKYKTKESAAKAIEALNGYEIKNKKLKVAVARKHCKEIRNSNLYVTHLPKTLDDQGLEAIFKEYGKLIECRVLKDKQQRCRGVGFVRFDKHENAVKAMKALNKTTPAGWQRELRMKLASKRHDYPPASPWRFSPHMDWWSGFYPPTPSVRSPRTPMMAPWGPPSPSPRRSQRLRPESARAGRMRSSPRNSFGGFYPGEMPYGYPHPHPGYPYSQWGPMAMWDSTSGKSWPRGRGRGGYGSPRGRRTPRRSNTAIVTNLSETTAEDDLMTQFQDLNIQSCKIVRSSGRGNKKSVSPHAYLNFTNYKSAHEALKKDGTVLKGRALKIHLKQ